MLPDRHEFHQFTRMDLMSFVKIRVIRVYHRQSM